MRVLSLGAGVQSTTLALLAADGGIEMPDCAVFSDTGWEPAAVYRHLDWLAARLPYPVHRVQHGNLRHDVLHPREGKQMANPPFFTGPAPGILRRQCTETYKVGPIRRKVREMLGLRPGQRAPREPVVEQWIGISVDEAVRMKPSREAWVRHRWPLVERGMNRWDCLRWLDRHGYPEPPKSACVGCPYHSDAYWREMRDQRPEEWADAVAFDESIRGGVRGTTSTLYLHASRQPLRDADLSTAEDHGQMQLGFGQECEGMCGT